MTSAQTERLLQAARSRAASLGIAVSVAVLDAGGHLKAFSRMDRAWLAIDRRGRQESQDVRAVRNESENVWEFSKPDAQAHGLDLTNDVLVTFAGGIPLRAADGALLGAIGVSGGQVSQDREVAQAGARALLEPFASLSSDAVSG